MVRNDGADDVAYPPSALFILVHVSCFAVLWTGVTVQAVMLGTALYFLRIFAIGAGYHRYFAHRSFRTSRAFQFFLAFLAQTSVQRGILWWAAHHRRHHRYADTDLDVHSPILRGFLYAHLGWIFVLRNNTTNLEVVSDLACYPELRWLDRLSYLPAILLGSAVWFVGGWPALIGGFCWSTVAVWHVTFSVNSLAHLFGKRRYVTGDQSRNNWFLALLTMGEGWHNNHHAYQASARQGFLWWEYDPTFYLLKALSYVGLVWDLRVPPRAMVKREQMLGRRVVEKAGAQIAASFPINAITSQILVALARNPGRLDLRTRVHSERLQAEALWAEIDRSLLPTLDDIRLYAKGHLAQSPFLDEIAISARRHLFELVYARLVHTASEHE
jgi:stearoyl-CoA desaturase (Delta-9 desaturase)